MINIRHTLLRLMIKISYKRFSKRSHKINSNNVVGPERALHCPGGCPTRQFAKLICTKFAKQTDRAWEGITPAPGTACWVRHRPAWQQNTPSAIFDLVFFYQVQTLFTRRWDNLPAFATLHIEDWSKAREKYLPEISGLNCQSVLLNSWLFLFQCLNSL